MNSDRVFSLDKCKANTKLDVSNREQYQRTELQENILTNNEEAEKQEPPQ